MSNSPLRAFVDESIAMRGEAQQEYLLCAALIAEDACVDTRLSLRRLLKPGQVKWHWTDESGSRKREMIEAISSLGSLNVIVTHLDAQRRKVDRYRRKCLETLYRELASMEVVDLTLESRSPAQDRQDVAHLTALRHAGLDPRLRIEHLRGGDESLLWIADAVLGAVNAYAKGDRSYLEQLRSTVVFEARTPDSLLPENDEGP
ncbi:hypothetical protein [Demequina flava]|uniref:hypothetical protein n=1 Tax=Demequina flava TaxID=1095025 RepID=UPI0009E36C17|nr:hypothetical protein [Demequina flava]